MNEQYLTDMAGCGRSRPGYRGWRGCVGCGSQRIWLDQGSPWAIFTAEEIVYNADVDGYILAVGP